jgi:hypothetical protein
MPFLFGDSGGGSSGSLASISNAAFSNFGGAVSDLFAASGDRAKAQGDLIEAQNYDLASTLALQNEQFTQTSTAIRQAQIDRNTTQVLGEQQADVASAGFAESGSSLDLLADSARQGALTKAVAGEQGLITEAGYQEQSQSYQNLAQSARIAADAKNKAAEGSTFTGIIKGLAGVASIFLAPATGGASLAVGQAADSAIGDPSGIGGLY